MNLSSVVLILGLDKSLNRVFAGYLSAACTANLRTNIVDFRGFDSSIILILRGGIPRPTGDFPESLSQAILVGIMFVGRLGVFYGFALSRSSAPGQRLVSTTTTNNNNDNNNNDNHNDDNSDNDDNIEHTKNNKNHNNNNNNNSNSGNNTVVAVSRLRGLPPPAVGRSPALHSKVGADLWSIVERITVYYGIV